MKNTIKLIFIALCVMVIIGAFFLKNRLEKSRSRIIESLSFGKNGELVNMSELDEELPVFIFVYAPWCTYCKKMKNTWATLENKYKSNNKIIIKKINSDEALFKNEFSKVHNIKSFPTLLLIRNGESVEYENGRDEESLIKFIDENS